MNKLKAIKYEHNHANDNAREAVREAQDCVTLGEGHVHVVLGDGRGGDFVGRRALREVVKVVERPADSLLGSLRRGEALRRLGNHAHMSTLVKGEERVRVLILLGLGRVANKRRISKRLGTRKPLRAIPEIEENTLFLVDRRTESLGSSSAERMRPHEHERRQLFDVGLRVHI